MKPLDLVLMFLIVALVLGVTTDALSRLDKSNDETAQEYQDNFQQAVDDAGAYAALFQQQQEVRPIEYGKEKQLSMETEMLNTFYANVAMRFGVGHDKYGVQEIMMRIPASVFVEYDGYRLVTLSKLGSGTSVKYQPQVWEKKPFTYKLPNGLLVFFTMDGNMKMYDKSTNQYFEGTWEELKTIRDLSPMTSQSKFEETRKNTIASVLEKDLANAVNRHLQTVSNIGLQVGFNLPNDLADSIDKPGFYSMIQGYPLPGGEQLTAYSFSGVKVTKGRQFTGVIQGDGKHVAYETKCGIPSGSTVIETLYDRIEAAKKGYFVSECKQ